MHRLLIPYIFLFFFSLFLSTAAAAEESSLECRKSVCFSKLILVNNQKIPLRAVAQFNYYFFKVYTGALYYPSNSQFEVGKKPFRLELSYLRAIEKSDLIKPASDFLEKYSTNFPKIKDRVLKINSLYRSVKKGDRYSLQYEPQKGTSLYFNNELLGTIAGEDFAKEYFAIWLSNNTQAKSFRDKLFKEFNN